MKNFYLIATIISGLLTFYYFISDILLSMDNPTERERNISNIKLILSAILFFVFFVLYFKFSIIKIL